MATCGLGAPGRGTGTMLMVVLGMAAFVFAVLALVTGSLTALSFPVATIVVLWAASTLRHMHHRPRMPVTT